MIASHRIATIAPALGAALTLLPVGAIIEVTYTATDESGNAVTCTQVRVGIP
jgi:hypothetical protein